MVTAIEKNPLTKTGILLYLKMEKNKGNMIDKASKKAIKPVNGAFGRCLYMLFNISKINIMKIMINISNITATSKGI